MIFDHKVTKIQVQNFHEISINQEIVKKTVGFNRFSSYRQERRHSSRKRRTQKGRSSLMQCSTAAVLYIISTLFTGFVEVAAPRFIFRAPSFHIRISPSPSLTRPLVSRSQLSTLVTARVTRKASLDIWIRAVFIVNSLKPLKFRRSRYFRHNHTGACVSEKTHENPTSHVSARPTQK